MARSGTSAWLPKRPEEIPASGAARFHRAAGPASALGFESATGGAAPASASGRATRPFRFGSEDRPDPDPALTPGTLVGGRYRIMSLLGEGGMGRVYEAEHTVLQRRVALKLLRRGAEAAAENLARFQREALAASRIGAPQIVEIVDFDHHVGDGGAQTYMVMELLVGQNLEAWMQADRGLDRAVELLAQLCDGLAAAHRAGVIHRDIKPANVFCAAPDPGSPAARPRIKILDFGIAKITDGGSGHQTQRGALLGTPYYLAPERVMGATLSPAADIYSVGVIIYELLVGNVPFVADSFMGILARHVHDEALDPRQAAPGRAIPDGLANLCMRLLAKQPEQRPSAEVLADELRALLTSEGEALAAIRVGACAEVSGPGDATQVFDDPSDASVSERDTIAPGLGLGLGLGSGLDLGSVGGATTVGLGLEAGLGSSQARSSTVIGHGVAVTGEAVDLRPAPPSAVVAQPDPRRPRAGVIVGAVAAVGVVVALVGVLTAWAGSRDDAPGPTVGDRQIPDGGESDSALVGASSAEPGQPDQPDQPDPPDLVEPPAVSTPARDLAVEPAPAALPEPPATPSQSKPKPKSKPQSKPKSKPKAAPSPVADPPDPAPETNPKAPTDSQLPTIKDDVYD